MVAVFADDDTRKKTAFTTSSSHSTDPDEEQPGPRRSESPEFFCHDSSQFWNTQSCTADVEAMLGQAAASKCHGDPVPHVLYCDCAMRELQLSLDAAALAQASGSAYRPRTMPSTSSTGTGTPTRTGTPRASLTWRRLPWRCCCWMCTPPPPRWATHTHLPACCASAEGTVRLHCGAAKESGTVGYQQLPTPLRQGMQAVSASQVQDWAADSMALTQGGGAC